MKIRRALATAVAAAVTAPAVLLSVTPAFADTKPVAQTQNKSSKPTIKELEAAAAAAQKAYEEAVKARDEAQVTVRKAFEELSKDSHPLVAADNAAKQAAKDAAAAKTTADQAVTDAKAAIEALPTDATEEQKTAAATALSEAEAAATTAATAKTAADTKAAETNDAVQDARVAAARAASVADKALDDALAAKIAADAALAKAKKEAEEGQDCEPENDLTAKVTGLPTKLVAGTTTAFSLRVTNGSDRHMDEVIAYAGVHATDKSGLKDTGKFFRLQWSTKSSPKWQDINEDSYIDGVGALKPGARADVKMRLTLDKATPAGNGVAFIAADFFNEDGSCGGTPGADMYEFDVKAAGSKPGKTEDAKPKPSKTTKPGGNGHTPQGSASATPATNGNLAATGSSSATTSIALAGGAAVVLGAAAVFVVRRRKAGSDA
ncbi:MULTISPECIES: LAETG motif-containing sortase-dependent surface protein [unclassified Streptomyces]|uniref:LAETG motif-containing sortase-dependent surface protein n=1 Tax=unclassified Streptomyces TaxID=2593676 RepID=UPI000851FB7E|nr:MULTISPECIES: LAETG motif-containing sortase-dependent surface protein [unclassified Streptomyces]MDX3489340.1 LPXTG cell wall anchor domain-containing protein [Streptomyces sp. ID05-18]